MTNIKSALILCSTQIPPSIVETGVNTKQNNNTKNIDFVTLLDDLKVIFLLIVKFQITESKRLGVYAIT